MSVVHVRGIKKMYNVLITGKCITVFTLSRYGGSISADKNWTHLNPHGDAETLLFSEAYQGIFQITHYLVFYVRVHWAVQL